MDISISRMTFEEIAPIIPYVEKARLRVRNRINTIWFGAKQGTELVGIVSCVLRGSYVYYNTDFVREEFRKKGIYRRLFEEREQFVASLNIKLIKAKCTRNSLEYYLKKGFVKSGDSRWKSLTPVEKRLGVF